MATAEWVVKEYADMVYRLAFAQVRSKSDADDVFQEVFLRYVQDRQVFESEKHKKAWLIKAWLICVTMNCSKKHWSSLWFRKVVPAPAWFRKKARAEDSFVFGISEENEVHNAIKGLAPEYRAVIHLLYYVGTFPTCPDPRTQAV